MLLKNSPCGGADIDQRRQRLWTNFRGRVKPDANFFQASRWRPCGRCSTVLRTKLCGWGACQLRRSAGGVSEAGDQTRRRYPHRSSLPPAALTTECAHPMIMTAPNGSAPVEQGPARLQEQARLLPAPGCLDGVIAAMRWFDQVLPSADGPSPALPMCTSAGSLALYAVVGSLKPGAMTTLRVVDLPTDTSTRAPVAARLQRVRGGRIAS